MFIIRVLLSAPHSTANWSIGRLGLRKIKTAISSVSRSPQFCVTLKHNLYSCCVFSLCILNHFWWKWRFVHLPVQSDRRAFPLCLLLCINQYLMYLFCSFALSYSQSNALFINVSYLAKSPQKRKTAAALKVVEFRSHIHTLIWPL